MKVSDNIIPFDEKQVVLDFFKNRENSKKQRRKKIMILTLFVSMALTLVIGIYTVEKLKKKKIEQSERHDGPQSHLVKQGTPTSRSE